MKNEDKSKLIKHLKKIKKSSDEGVGSFKIKKRFFLVRWYQNFVKKSKYWLYKLIVKIFKIR